MYKFIAVLNNSIFSSDLQGLGLNFNPHNLDENSDSDGYLSDTCSLCSSIQGDQSFGNANTGNPFDSIFLSENQINFLHDGTDTLIAAPPQAIHKSQRTGNLSAELFSDGDTKLSNYYPKSNSPKERQSNLKKRSASPSFDESFRSTKKSNSPLSSMAGMKAALNELDYNYPDKDDDFLFNDFFDTSTLEKQRPFSINAYETNLTTQEIKKEQQQLEAAILASQQESAQSFQFGFHPTDIEKAIQASLITYKEQSTQKK